jgi:hypothetical protein
LFGSFQYAEYQAISFSLTNLTKLCLDRGKRNWKIFLDACLLLGIACNLLWLTFEEKYVAVSAQVLFPLLSSETPSTLFVPYIIANGVPEDQMVSCFFAYLENNNSDSGMSCESIYLTWLCLCVFWGNHRLVCGLVCFSLFLPVLPELEALLYAGFLLLHILSCI